jgi:hypothetical protein
MTFLELRFFIFLFLVSKLIRDILTVVDFLKVEGAGSYYLRGTMRGGVLSSLALGSLDFNEPFCLLSDS